MRLRTTPSRLIPASCFVPHKSIVIESAVIELRKFAERRQPRFSADVDLAPTLDFEVRIVECGVNGSDFNNHNSAHIIRKSADS